MTAPMKPARLLRVRDVARAAGTNKRTMLRRLRRLYERHGGDWLIRVGRVWMVNDARLRRAHPALFEACWTPREAFDDVVTRMGEFEKSIHEIVRSQKLLAAGLRGLRRDLRDLREAREAHEESGHSAPERDT